MNEIWDYIATDKEIIECNGDYIGCEICRNVKRCLELKLKKLEQAMQESKNGGK